MSLGHPIFVGTVKDDLDRQILYVFSTTLAIHIMKILAYLHNITSAWAVDREFVNIDWASLGPNFTQLGSNLIQIESNSDHIGSHWPLLGQKWSLAILESKL